MKYQLTHKLQQCVQNVASGMDSVQAAEAAGYRASYAKVLAARLKHHPAVVRALAEIREKGCAAAAYDLTRAMKEAEDAAEFAKCHKNSMANVKAVELRAKLSGLLIDRVEVVTVDLTGALEAARNRVFNITPRQGNDSATKVLTAARPPDHDAVFGD